MSTSLVLPEGYLPGYILDGWYSNPGLSPESYVGGRGDIYCPKSDTVLYAAFTEFDLYPKQPGETNEEYGARLKFMHKKTAEYQAEEAAREAAAEAAIFPVLRILAGPDAPVQAGKASHGAVCRP